MKLLGIGIDNTILDKNSKASQRMLWYSEVLDDFCIVVPNDTDKEVFLSKKVKVIGVGGGNKIIRLARMYFVLNKILKKEKFDTISSQDPFETAFVAWRVARKHNLFFNIQEHGDFFSEKYWRGESARNFYRYYLGKFLIKRVDSVRVVSEKIKNTLIKSGIAENKIINVPVYTEIKNLMTEKKKTEDDFVFLWIGRFVKQKNLPLLLNAFAELAQKYDDVKLRLVGSGEEKENIIKLIKKLKIKNKVELSDWVDDVAREYTQADAYVLSSNYEGWGRVIVEALVYNLPIIMTNVGCANELIEHKKSGLVIPIGDRQKLKQAMEEIYQNKDLREKLKKNARQVLKKMPNKQKTLELYLKSWQKS